MTLYKYCKPEHNLADSCRTVRLGTFEYYRNQEVDRAEGKGFLHIASLRPDSPSEDIDALFPGWAGTGRYQGSMINCRMQTEFRNSYIFCCSTLPTLDAQKVFGDDDYTSQYTIDDPERFADSVSVCLIRDLTLDRIAPSYSSQGLSLSDLTVRAHIDEVRYVPGKIVQTIGGRGPNPFPSDVGHQIGTAFTKDPRFDAESEFRMVFTLFHPIMGIVPVTAEPIDVTLIAWSGQVRPTRH